MRRKVFHCIGQQHPDENNSKKSEKRKMLDTHTHPPTHKHTHPHPHTHTYTPKPQRARAWSGLYVNSELSFWFFFKYETILQQENSLFFKRIRTFKRWKVVRRRSNQKCPVIPVELQMAWLRHVGNLEGAAKAEHLHVLRPAAIFPGHTTQK